MVSKLIIYLHQLAFAYKAIINKIQAIVCYPLISLRP